MPPAPIRDKADLPPRPASYNRRSGPALTLPQSPRRKAAMTERPRVPPRLSEAGQRTRASRDARLAEALRDNLRKRKAQARGRIDGAEEAASDPPAPPASGEEA